MLGPVTKINSTVVHYTFFYISCSLVVAELQAETRGCCFSIQYTFCIRLILTFFLINMQLAHNGVNHSKRCL
jgi:hypothetical protein